MGTPKNVIESATSFETGIFDYCNPKKVIKKPQLLRVHYSKWPSYTRSYNNFD